MYDRAARKLTVAEDRTPTHVGPGTYPRHEINGRSVGGKLPVLLRVQLCVEYSSCPLPPVPEHNPKFCINAVRSVNVQWGGVVCPH